MPNRFPNQSGSPVAPDQPTLDFGRLRPTGNPPEISSAAMSLQINRPISPKK